MGDRRTALTFGLLIAAGLACAPRLALAQPAEGDAPAPTDPEATDTPPADQPVVKDPVVAKKWLQAADTLMKKADQLAKQGKQADAKVIYENAATAYSKAIEASDDGAAIQLPLAQALEKSGDAAGAMKTLKALLATQGLKPDLQKKAQAKYDEMSMTVGLVTLVITPEGTAVSIGGKPIGEAPLAEPIVLPPGNHVVTFTAVGYQPKDVELKIEAGSESERKIELEPVSVVVKPSDGGDTDGQTGPTGPKPPSLMPIYIGGGATAGLLLIGTITGIVAIGKHGQFEDATTESERSDLRSSGKTFALVTDLCLVGAVGAAAFTTYWYMYKYRPEAKALAERQAMRHSSGGTPKVGVVPWVQPDAGGLVAVGAF